MMLWLQVVGVLLLTASRQTAAEGEVGKGPNDCYASMPSVLPLTISYSTSSNSSATSFNFLVIPRSQKVTAFGIRLKDDLAQMPSRLSGIPEGQFVPQGPAYLWQISGLNAQTFTFTLNTTGLTRGTGPNSVPDLTDLCAQGIQIADNAGNLIWQQETSGSSCVSWVQQEDKCSFQTIEQHDGVSLSPKLQFPVSYGSPVTYSYGAPPFSSPPAYGVYYSSAFPAIPSPAQAPQLFGMRPAPAAYSPSVASSPRSSPYSPAPGPPPRPSASSPTSVPYYSPPAAYSPRAPPATLFGGPRVSPPALGLSPYASPVAHGPNVYGAAPYSPASPPQANPYYGLPAPGTYGPAASAPPSRALLSADDALPAGPNHLFGAHRLLASLPLVSKLLAPTCNLVGQQAEPACMHQGKCAHCFQKAASDLGIRAGVSVVYNEAANQTSLTLTLAAADMSMSVLDSVSLRVSKAALSSQLEPRILATNSASGLPLPKQNGMLHSSCDDTGLQSSVTLSQVALVAGKAAIEVHLQGKVEPLQDDVFVMNGSGQTKLLAEAGMAVITVRSADDCYFQTMNVLR